MPRITKLWVLFLAAGGVNACNNLDEIVPTTAIPTAGVRFINAVPDTNTLDMRFIDIVENNAQFNVGFRNNPVTTSGVTASTLVQYKPAMAGSRHFKIFLSDADQNVASVFIEDTTVTLTAGSNYTAILWGNGRGGAPAMKLTFFEETVADPGTNIALRVINATGNVIDAEQYTSSGAATGTPTTGWAAIPALTASAYFTRAPGTVKIRVTPTGSPTTPLTPDGTALLGSASSFSGDTACTRTGTATTLPYCDTQANGGTLIAGSAVSAILFPGSVTGSKAAQFNTTTGSARLGVTAAGYEGPRSFITDGFQVGQQVNASGSSFNAANLGLSTVTSITDGKTRSSSATVRLNAGVSGAGIYGRSSGSFVTDGFVAGNVVTVTGFLTAANNGESTITNVAATQLTTTAATVAEAGTVTTTMSANAAGYSRTAGSWITDGFLVGHTITASGFTNAANNGTSTITFVNPNGLDISVSKTPAPVVEAAASRTIAVSTTRSITEFGKLNVTKAGGTVVDAAAGSRTIAASPNSPGVSYVWDRRPPKGCLAPYC